MKVLYDISWLGLSHGKGAGPTGLGRVIEALALQLEASPEVDLTLCAGDSFAALSGCLDLRRRHPELGSGNLAYPKLRALSRVQLHRLLSRLHRSERPSLPTRALRRPLRIMSRWLGEGRGTLDAASIAGAQIYHSPFLPVPPAIRGTKLKAALTVYDLIPKLFPELAPVGSAEILDATLQSITPDDVVLCISEATKSDLCHYLPRLDPKKIIVTYLGVSDHFRPTPAAASDPGVRIKYGIPDGPYLLSLSSLEPRKGMDHLVRCFGQMVTQQKLSDLNLVLAGPKGWKDEAILDTLATHSHLKDRVVVTGRIDDEDLPRLYTDALAFVFPSLYEGFGLPALEAMKCGTPVIASNTSALPEVIGDAGLLVDPRDHYALCEAMLKVYSDGSLREELSSKGINRAKEFSWEKCARQTIAGYQIALGS